ncbi:MAG: hypothetical protein M5R36_07520 [Deltaproteobacteria bacterium]|nr:hypothetical protein [Deltaproteobacteria bacterium]
MNPEGLAFPEQKPRYPQPFAEIMACYRPVQEFEIERPASLDDYVVAPLTAYEFGWISHGRVSKLYPGH